MPPILLLRKKFLSLPIQHLYQRLISEKANLMMEHQIVVLMVLFQKKLKVAHVIVAGVVIAVTYKNRMPNENLCGNIRNLCCS